MMMMAMYFWEGVDITWLFYGVESTNSGSYFGGLIVVFLLAITVELIMFGRNLVYVKAQIYAIQKTEELNADATKILVDLSLGNRLLLLLCYVVMLLLAFCLMLLVMTFNVNILFVISLGLAIGHLITQFLTMPELPAHYKQLAGSGAYMPEADNCCNKMDTLNAICHCPGEEKPTTIDSSGNSTLLR